MNERLRDRTAYAAWLPAGVAVAAVGWGANQFVPLLTLYRSELGLSTALVEATFGVYALGLVPGLLLGGPISDRIGRRRVMLAALVASLVGSALLVAGGSGAGWLFAGRTVAGLASGAAFSSGAAWIRELSGAGDAGSSAGPRRATVAMTTGFAAGPLVAGLLAQWAPYPTVLPYLPHLVLTLLVLPLIPRIPEGVGATGNPVRRFAGVRHPRFRTVVAPLAPWVFGSASVALAYLPTLVAPGHGVLVFGAVVATLTAMAGVLVQPLARAAEGWGRRAPVLVALGLVIAGLLVAAAATDGNPVLIVVAALVLGAGYGCCQVCGLREVQRLAGPDDLAGATAAFQAISYLGFAAPLLLATAAHHVPPSVPLLAAAVLAALTLVRTAAAVAR